MADFELWERETLNEFAREATRKLIENDAEIRRLVHELVALHCVNGALRVDADELHRLRARVNRLRGLCKSAAGWLLDADDIEHHEIVLDLIGDMEPYAPCARAPGTP